MYPEIQTDGKLMSPDPVQGQVLHSPVSMSPQPTLQVPSPQVVQIPQNIQQSFATDAAIGLQYQMSMYAQCARGHHQVERKYGPCGIITGVLLFPIGLLALIFDVQKRCSRCGAKLPKKNPFFGHSKSE